MEEILALIAGAIDVAKVVGGGIWKLLLVLPKEAYIIGLILSVIFIIYSYYEYDLAGSAVSAVMTILAIIGVIIMLYLLFPR